MDPARVLLGQKRDSARALLCFSVDSARACLVAGGLLLRLDGFSLDPRVLLGLGQNSAEPQLQSSKGSVRAAPLFRLDSARVCLDWGRDLAGRTLDSARALRGGGRTLPMFRRASAWIQRRSCLNADTILQAQGSAKLGFSEALGGNSAGPGRCAVFAEMFSGLFTPEFSKARLSRCGRRPFANITAMPLTPRPHY